jgi:FAD/FMN-containing dehydrogenase
VSDCDVKSESEAIFGSNYTKLQELKKEYDPNVVFSKWFVVTPAA